jgi:hypothetical protein
MTQCSVRELAFSMTNSGWHSFTSLSSCSLVMAIAPLDSWYGFLKNMGISWTSVVIVRSFCFALKSVLATVSAVWPHGHGHRARGCAAGGRLSTVAVPRWLALGSASCAPNQVWRPPLHVMCAYCWVTHRAAPCFSYHVALPCSEGSQLLTSPTSPLVTHALYSYGVCDAFRHVNLTLTVLCFSACCSCLAKSINNRYLNRYANLNCAKMYF